jgi:hypothetical protein
MKPSYSKRLDAIEQLSRERRAQEFKELIDAAERQLHDDPERMRPFIEARSEFGPPPHGWGNDVDWQAFSDALARCGVTMTPDEARREVWEAANLLDETCGNR